MVFSKILSIVLKAIPVFPVVVKAIVRVEEARALESAGGKKVTTEEALSIVTIGVKEIAEAVAKAAGL